MSEVDMAEHNQEFRGRFEELGAEDVFEEAKLGNWNAAEEELENIEDKDAVSDVLASYKEIYQNRHGTEEAEGTELTERGFRIGRYLNQSENKEIRLSGKLDDETYFHTIFAQNGDSYEPLVITSDGDVLSVKNRLELEKDKKEDIEQPERLDYQFFKWDGEEYRYKHKITNFPELDLYQPGNKILRYFQADKNPKKEIYNRIREKIWKYWDHYSEEWFDVLTAWIIHTYLVDGIAHTPYLMFRGQEDTGKSTGQKVSARMTYNGFFTGKSTGPSTSRIAHYTQATLHLDEWEKASNKEIEGVFNTGQRKGGKYTFTDMNREKVENQIQALYSFCPKTLSVNSLHPFDSHFISRNIIIEATRAKRSLDTIESIDAEEAEEFQEIRNELMAYALFNWKSLIEGVEDYREELDLSGRESDKISVICGLIQHFKGEEKTEEVENFLKDLKGGEEESISNTSWTLLERVVDMFGEDSEMVKVRPGELADYVNQELQLSEEYEWSGRTVPARLKEFDLIRNPEKQGSRSSSTGGYEYEIPREYVVDSLTRYGLFRLRDRLVETSESGSEPSTPSVSSVDGPTLADVVNTVSELQNGENPVAYPDVLAEFPEDAEERVREALDKAKEEGDLYEPQQGGVAKL